MSTQTTDAAAWLDRLEEARKAATPGVWTAEPNFTGGWALARALIVNADGMPVYTPSGWTCYDAALVVAAVNALPELVAVVRGVLALADSLERDAGMVHNPETQAQRRIVRHLRELVAAAHTEEA